MAEYAEDRIPDATGLLCPMPVVKTSQEFRDLDVFFIRKGGEG